MSDQFEPLADAPEPANLRFLRRLVTLLTATMIFGLIAIFTVLVIRLRTPDAVFPDLTALPDGISVLSVTRTPTEIIVIDDQRILYLLTFDGQVLIHQQPIQ
ncbi:MAG: DUF6476 family protein [Planktomarina sp.]